MIPSVYHLLKQLMMMIYDRLVARYLTKYGFRYVNETQYLQNNMVVFGTGVFGHAFCPDERYEVSLHHNAASWLPKKTNRGQWKKCIQEYWAYIFK